MSDSQSATKGTDEPISILVRFTGEAISTWTHKRFTLLEIANLSFSYPPIERSYMLRAEGIAQTVEVRS